MKTSCLIYCLTLAIFSVSATLTAQIGFRLSYQKPSAEFGNQFKPSIMFEGTLGISPQSAKFKKHIAVGMITLKPRNERRSVYRIVNNEILVPGTETILHYVALRAAYGAEYSYWPDKNWRPIVGLDGIAQYESYKAIVDIEGEERSEESFNSFNLGVLPKFGASHRIYEWLEVDFAIGKHLSAPFIGNQRHYWKIEAGIHF